MKITKRQLKRIIKEEKVKLMREGVSQSLIENLFNAMNAIASAADDDQQAIDTIMDEAQGFVDSLAGGGPHAPPPPTPWRAELYGSKEL
jgi:hypothetical protein